MSIRAAQVDLAHSPAARMSSMGRSDTDDGLYRDRPMAAARGIISAIVISVPFWALLACALYLLF